jgi:hypothetical protein
MAGTRATDYPLPRTLVIGGKRIDRRSMAARRYYEVCGDLAGSLSKPPNASQWLLIARAAGLTVQAETFERDLAKGNAIDTEAYTRVTGLLTAVLRNLRLTSKGSATAAPVSIDPHTAALGGGDG